jgi:hypothetical protein
MDYPKDFLLDRRLVDRHITRGALSRKDYEAELAKLPDVAGQAVATSVRVEHVTFRIAVPGLRRTEEPRVFNEEAGE